MGNAPPNAVTQPQETQLLTRCEHFSDNINAQTHMEEEYIPIEQRSPSKLHPDCLPFSCSRRGVSPRITPPRTRRRSLRRCTSAHHVNRETEDGKLVSRASKRLEKKL